MRKVAIFVLLALPFDEVRQLWVLRIATRDIAVAEGAFVLFQLLVALHPAGFERGDAIRRLQTFFIIYHIGTNSY